MGRIIYCLLVGFILIIVSNAFALENDSFSEELKTIQGYLEKEQQKNSGSVSARVVAKKQKKLLNGIKKFLYFWGYYSPVARISPHLLEGYQEQLFDQRTASIHDALLLLEGSKENFLIDLERSTADLSSVKDSTVFEKINRKIQSLHARSNQLILKVENEIKPDLKMKFYKYESKPLFCVWPEVKVWALFIVLGIQKISDSQMTRKEKVKEVNNILNDYEYAFLVAHRAHWDFITLKNMIKSQIQDKVRTQSLITGNVLSSVSEVSEEISPLSRYIKHSFIRKGILTLLFNRLTRPIYTEFGIFVWKLKHPYPNLPIDYVMEPFWNVFREKFADFPETGSKFLWLVKKIEGDDSGLICDAYLSREN